MARAVMITGSNMGDRETNLAGAAALVAARVGRVVRRSAVAGSQPWGDVAPAAGEDVPCDFLNQVLVVETALGPFEALNELQAIEREMGREPAVDDGREHSYRSRTVDIDILLWDDEVIDTPRLVVPHPLMHRRRFALEPLAALMPAAVHPASGRTVSELLEELDKKTTI